MKTETISIKIRRQSRSHDGHFRLERLPVTEEAAGSSPVAPAIVLQLGNHNLIAHAQCDYTEPARTARTVADTMFFE